MKIFLLIISLILFVNSSHSQWIQQQSNAGNSLLNDIRFINKKTGWCVGDSPGIILKTTDGGVNWLQQVNPLPDRTLTCVFPVDSEYVYIAGFGQTVLKTTNGGTNWIIVQSGSSISYYTGMFFANKDRGWIAANDRILLTVNGGFSFDTLRTIYGATDIYFRNEFEGVASAGLKIYYTTNAGFFWDTSVTQSFGPNFEQLSFINQDTGFVSTYSGRVFKTTNFGLTWDSIPKPPDSHSIIRFINNNTGWVGGDYGHLYKTTNGGINWVFQNLSQFNLYRINHIHSYNDSLLWMSCNIGKILFTSNGGTSFISNNEQFVQDFKLYQNYPNPFNPATTIEYELKQRGFVKLNVYDINGKEIEQLVNENKPQGNYKVKFAPTALPSGVYFYKLEVNNYTDTKRMLLLK